MPKYIDTDGLKHYNTKVMEKISTDYVKVQDLENNLNSKVNKTTTVNGKALSSNIELNAADVGALPSNTQIPTVNNGTLTIQKNGTSVGTFGANQSENTTVNILVPTQASDVNALSNSTKYGASISLSINNTTYVVTVQLKDQNGNNLGEPQTIDLPLESVVVSGSYDKTTKKVILTLKDGSTVDFSVADLVSGLASQSDLDTTNNNVSSLSTEVNNVKSSLSGKLDKTGGTLTGTVTMTGGDFLARYVGISAAGHETSTYDKIAILSNTTNGYIRYRTKAELASDLGVPTDYVTTNTAQTISGAKTFTQDIVKSQVNGNEGFIIKNSGYGYQDVTDTDINIGKFDIECKDFTASSLNTKIEPNSGYNRVVTKLENKHVNSSDGAEASTYIEMTTLAMAGITEGQIRVKASSINPIEGLSMCKLGNSVPFTSLNLTGLLDLKGKTTSSYPYISLSSSTINRGRITCASSVYGADITEHEQALVYKSDIHAFTSYSGSNSPLIIDSINRCICNEPVNYSADTVYDLGSSSVPFGNLYVNNINLEPNCTITMGGTTNATGANIKWSTVNSKIPYIGYATDQTDGTFVWSTTGTTYKTGLAIGGGSGNLLWKGVKVATTSDIPTDYAKKAEGVYFVDGTGNTTAGTWTGTNDRITSYYDGLTVNFKIGVAGGSSTTTLNINGLGAKTCYLRGTTKITTHYAVGTIVIFTYNATTDAFYSSDYDSNTSVTQTLRESSSYNGNFPLLLRGTSAGTTTTTTSTSFGTKMTANPYTGELKATKFTENGTTLANKYVTLDTEQTISGSKTFTGVVIVPDVTII